MKDPMDDSLDNAEEDMVFEGNSKDDETSSSVDTLFKVEESGEESCGEDQENFQGFRDRGEGSSGEDVVYGDAGGDSNTASDREGYMEPVSDYDGYDGSPPSGGGLQAAARGIRTSHGVISGFVSLGGEGGSLLDAFDPDADPVFVDRSAKNASPAGKFFRELRSSPEEGGCGPDFVANEEGDSESNHGRFLGLSTDCSAIRGASFHNFAPVGSLCDDGSEEGTLARGLDRIETLRGAYQENVSCCSGEEADRANSLGLDKNQFSEEGLDAVAKGRVERRKGKKGSRKARRQVEGVSASDYKNGEGLSTFEGFDVGDVVGPERLTRSRASGRYVPVRNANGESVVILANSFPVSQKVENGAATNSATKEVSGKTTGKRSATRGGRLGWSHSVDNKGHGDVQQVTASQGAEDGSPLQYDCPASATLAKKKPSERSTRKEGKSSKRTSGPKAVRKVTYLKFPGTDSAQLDQSAACDDGTEQDVVRIESGSAVKRRTPRQRSKIRGYGIDGHVQECGESVPSVATDASSHEQSLENEAVQGARNTPRRQPGQRGYSLEANHENQEVQVGRRQVADKGGSCRREVFSAAAEFHRQVPSEEVLAGRDSCFTVENSLKPQGEGSFGSSVWDELMAIPKNPLLVLVPGHHGMNGNVDCHTVQLSLSETVMCAGDEMDTMLPKLLNRRSQLKDSGTESAKEGFQDSYLGSASSRLTSTKVGSLEVKPLRNGQVSRHLSLVEGIGSDSQTQELLWRSGSTDLTCESNLQLSREKISAALTSTADVMVEKSALADGIGSDGPAGSILDNAEMSSFVGKEGRALRPRRCKSEIPNGTSGAKACVAVQPNVKSSSKQKKQDVVLTDVAKTGAGNPKKQLKGKRKRSGSVQVAGTDLQVCSENKSMNQDCEGTSDKGQHSPKREMLLNKEGSGKRRKKGRKEVGKTKTVNSKKPTRRSSGQKQKSISLLKSAEDLQMSPGGSENHEHMVHGSSIVPPADVQQAADMENHVQLHGNSVSGDSLTASMKVEMGTNDGEEHAIGLGIEVFETTVESHGRGPANVGQKESRLARKRACPSDTKGLSAYTHTDAGGVVGQDASTQSADYERSTKNSSTAPAGQEQAKNELPRVGWVLCDACSKWRCIPAELADQIEATNATWICKENPNKDYADCSIPQEKSNADINAELQISELSGAEDENDRDGDVDSGFQQEVRPAVWTLIPHNIYLHRQRKHTTLDEMMVCNCTQPADGGPGCDENCLNRILQYECQQGHCPCGDNCSNQQFRNRAYAKVESFRCGKKGFGLRALANIPKGNFIIEYVGEVLDIDAFEVRQKEYARNGQKHFYFMTMDGNEVIDACVKGNLGRFINHSCEPNCQTEKWVVDGEVCIGLFATKDLTEGEEITFDYNYVRVGGAAAKKCECGSQGCRGFIGGDPLTPRAVVESDSDEEEDPEPIMLDGSLEAASAPGRADGSKVHSSRKARVPSEPKVKGAPKVTGVKRKLSRESEADKEGAKPRHAAAVKRVKTSKLQLPRSGSLNVKCLTIDTTHRQQRSDVEEKLNEMLDEHGGLRKKKDSAKHYLRLLVLVPVSVDSQAGLSSQRSRGLKDLSLLLDALQKTRSPVVLRDIMCKNGLMMLHNLIKHFRKDYEKLPILRKLMKVLDWLASQKVLTPEQMYASRPGNGIESFTESLFELTRHSDKEVQNMARNFRRVYLPPASKVLDLSAKENGWSSPPKHLQPLDQSNARGRPSAPGFHQHFPPNQDPHNSTTALDQVSRPAVPLSAQKLTSQDWSPSSARSGAPGSGASTGIVQPEKVPEIGKQLNFSEGTSKEQDGAKVNEDGGLPRKRKRKSRWDECTAPACPVQGGEVVSTGQISCTVPGGPIQCPSEWAKQPAQGYQRYWHQQPPPKHPLFRDHMASAPHTSAAPAGGPPLPPGFTPSAIAAPPCQFGPSVAPQPSLICGPIAGQVTGPHGSSQGHVPQAPPTHAMGMSSFPSGAVGPHMPGVPGAQHGPWNVRVGAPIYSGPPGFQVDVSGKGASPWSKRHSEPREPWTHPKEQSDGEKQVDAEIEPEPPVPGLSPRDQKLTGDGPAVTRKGSSRDSVPGQQQTTKELSQVDDTSKVSSRSGLGSPNKDRIRKELWGGKSRHLVDEQRGPQFSGQSDRDKPGSGRTESRKDRGQGHSRWEHSEGTLHELARGERSWRYDWSRSKESLSGRGNLSAYQHSEGHGQAYHRRPSKEMDFASLGDKCIQEGNVVAWGKTNLETKQSVIPAREGRPGNGVLDPASSQDRLEHVAQKESGRPVYQQNMSNPVQNQDHRTSNDKEVPQDTAQLVKQSDGSTEADGGDCMEVVFDPPGIYEAPSQVEEQPLELVSGHRDGGPIQHSPGLLKTRLDQQSTKVLPKEDVQDKISDTAAYNTGEQKPLVLGQMNHSSREQSDNALACPRSGPGAAIENLLPSCDTRCKDVQPCFPLSASDPEVQVFCSSSFKECGEDLAEGPNMHKHCPQDESATSANPMDKKDTKKPFGYNVDLDARPKANGLTAIEAKEHCGEAKEEPKHADMSRDGHKPSTVTWSHDLHHAEGNSRHNGHLDGNSKASSYPPGDAKQPGTIARNQPDDSCRNNAQLEIRPQEPPLDPEGQMHMAGSHSGHTSQWANPGARHSHDSAGRPSAGDVPGRRHSFRPGVDGWESPESPGFQEHVQSLVRHFLPAYKKLNSRDMDKLNGRLGPEVIKKERKSHMISTQTGCAKPIMRKRLDDKVRNFVDQQVRLYLAMKEKDRRGSRGE